MQHIPSAVFTHPSSHVPTNHMTDGPLMGNGDMTAVQGGIPDIQTWYIAKNDFWTDGEGWGFTNEQYHAYVVAPVTIGGVRLFFRDFECATYHQEQSLATAELTGRFEVEERCVTVRSWLSATENKLVIDVTLEPGAAGTLGLRIQTFAKTSDDPNASLPTQAGHDNDIAWVTRETWNRGRWVARACLATRVFGARAHAWTPNAHSAAQFVLLEPGQTIRIVVTLVGGKDVTGHRLAATQAALNLQPRDLDALKDAHRAWWKNFWSQSRLDVSNPLIQRFWHGALYALACASRPGCVAPGIFGFATDDHPIWSGDYHLNYNFEHPFLGVCAANHPELLESYVDAINAFIPEGQRRAHHDLSPPMPGVYYPIGIAPWGTVAQDDYMSQKCAAVYAAVPYLEHFHYMRDVDFTRDKLYPFLREVADFWQHFLVRDEGGRYHIHGSASHEFGAHDRDAAFDLPLVRRHFSLMTEIAEALNVDADRLPAWRDIARHLAPYPTASHNGMTVFKEAENAPGFTRSISLYNVLWPGGGDLDDTLRETGRNTLRALNLWHQGNSFSWIFTAAVRAGLEETRDKFCERLAAPNGLRQNLILAQAYGGLETCGAIQAVNEMLLQNHGGVIRLFPAWPADEDARFDNFRVSGGVRVSAELRGGRIASAVFCADRDTTLTLDITRLNLAELTLRADGAAVSVARDNNLLTFQATAQKRYELT